MTGRIKIVGAGMAGLLAGNLLSRRGPVVLEAQSELPNNHSAVLRFRSSVVADATGIPFKSVMMIKGVLPWKNEIADALAYSFKNTGVRRSDRSVVSGLVAEERFIAPPDFISRLAQGSDVWYNSPCEFKGERDGPPYISTIPMPTLAELLDYPDQNDVEFEYRSGWNIKATIRNTDAYVSLLVPDPRLSFSRVSLTGDELIVEVPNEAIIDQRAEAEQAAALLGIPASEVEAVESHRSTYQKILPIDERARKRFLVWATQNHGVYALGRYATARPGLLLDSLVQDIRLIESWIDTGHYEMMKRR